MDLRLLSYRNRRRETDDLWEDISEDIFWTKGRENKGMKTISQLEAHITKGIKIA
jgi:hypothetical protein